MKHLFLVLSFSIFSLIACSVPFDELHLTGGGSSNDSGFDFQNSPVDFKTVQETSLRTCLQCHSSGGMDFHNPQVVIDWRSEILSAIDDGSMPPKSSGLKPVTPCEREILQTWLDDQLAQRKSLAKIAELAQCGGVQNPPVDAPLDLSKLEPTFENVKAHIFASKCIECHKTGRAKGKVNLESLDLIQAKGLLTPSFEQSPLYARTVRRGSGQMPPVQSGLPVLTEEEMGLLKRWLEKEAHDRVTP